MNILIRRNLKDRLLQQFIKCWHHFKGTPVGYRFMIEQEITDSLRSQMELVGLNTSPITSWILDFGQLD